MSQSVKNNFKMIVRMCHHCSKKDQTFYHNYQQLGKQLEIPKIDPPPEIDPTPKIDPPPENLSYHGWKNSHLEKMMTEGDNDDVFLL